MKDAPAQKAIVFLLAPLIWGIFVKLMLQNEGFYANDALNNDKQAFQP